MDNDNRRVLTILSTLTLIVLLVGATFAYYSSISTSEPQVITTSSLAISINLKGSTNVDNIKPTTWVSLASAETNTDIVKIPFSVTTPAGVKAIYDVNMKATIPTNSKFTGGSASDFKYKLFKQGEITPLKEGSLDSNFDEDIINNAPILEGVSLNDNYILYVYIENKNESQNTLQDINMTISLTGRADQID
ncbi:MAG: hypothetical protein E7166_05270 [Firmicutes bacterium]|nr:hypothetical protein [Bacillota bacterium]